MDFSQIYNTQFISESLRNFYGIQAVKLLKQGSFNDINFKITTVQKKRYLAKITLSTKLPYLQIQNRAMLFLNEKLEKYGLQCCRPLVSLNNQYIIPINKQFPHYLRVFNFIQGQVLNGNNYSQETHQIFKEYGKTLGIITKQFKEFNLSQKDVNQLKILKSDEWNLKHASKLRKYIKYLNTEEQIQLVSSALQDYETKILPLLESFDECLIHNDLHNENILLESNENQIIGVIDFGDIAYTCKIFQLVIGMTSAMHGTKKSLEAAKTMLKGYTSIIQITEQQLEALYYLICVRDSTQLTMAKYELTLNPDNTYISDSVNGYFSNLKFMSKIGPKKFYSALKGSISKLQKDE